MLCNKANGIRREQPFGKDGNAMSTHPEISHMDREQRIRAIAYALWEEEGQPEGRDVAHWLRACELVGAEAEPVDEQAPGWLQRIEPPPAEAAESAEQTRTVADIARKIASARAA